MAAYHKDEVPIYLDTKGAADYLDVSAEFLDKDRKQTRPTIPYTEIPIPVYDLEVLDFFNRLYAEKYEPTDKV